MLHSLAEGVGGGRFGEVHGGLAAQTDAVTLRGIMEAVGPTEGTVGTTGIPVHLRRRH